MNRWEIKKEVRQPLLHAISEWLKQLEDRTQTPLDLTDMNVAPYHVWKLLEELGYEKTDMDSNGWQQDFWIYMTKNDSPTLVISATGMTHEVSLEVDWDYVPWDVRDANLAEIFAPLFERAQALIKEVH